VQRKRKHDDDEHGDDAEAKRVKLPAQRTAAKPAKANTAIYVTGLPKDTTVDELHEFFSKFGVIAESPEIKGIKQVTYDEEGDPVVNKIGPPRIKLYKNDDGSPKGDALIVFLDAQSVASAVDYGDESDFRAGTGKGSVIIRVDVADLSYKKTFDADEEGRKKLKEEATKTKFVSLLLRSFINTLTRGDLGKHTTAVSWSWIACSLSSNLRYDATSQFHLEHTN